jgi:hypothetical protein
MRKSTILGLVGMLVLVSFLSLGSAYYYYGSDGYVGAGNYNSYSSSSTKVSGAYYGPKDVTSTNDQTLSTTKPLANGGSQRVDAYIKTTTNQPANSYRGYNNYYGWDGYYGDYYGYNYGNYYPHYYDNYGYYNPWYQQYWEAPNYCSYHDCDRDYWDNSRYFYNYDYGPYYTDWGYY